jgi:hypothetical protein
MLIFVLCAVVAVLSGRIFEQAADGAFGAWFALAMIVFLPDLAFVSLTFLLDSGPSLVIGADGFRFRWAYHDYGAFRWDQIEKIRIVRVRSRKMLVITVSDGATIRTRPTLLPDLIERIGLGSLLTILTPADRRGRIVIHELLLGGRLDEAEALLHHYVAEKFAR